MSIMSETEDFTVSIPILLSLNIKETKTFYQDSLGFDIHYDDGQYLICRRDNIEIHLQLVEDKNAPTYTGCYIRGGLVPHLYEEYREKNIPRLSDFKVLPWNMKEFHLFDPHGNLLRFGCDETE